MEVVILMINLSIRGRTFFIVVVLSVVSICCTLLFVFVNDYIFLDPIRDSLFHAKFYDGALSMYPHDKDSIIVDLDVNWPISSIVFYCILLSVYWFLLGVFAGRNLKYLSVRSLLVVPVVSNLINLNLFVFWYMFLCYIGRHFAISAKGAEREKR